MSEDKESGIGSVLLVLAATILAIIAVEKIPVIHEIAHSISYSILRGW